MTPIRLFMRAMLTQSGPLFHGQFAVLHVKIDGVNHRKMMKLRRLLWRVAEPPDYFEGIRRYQDLPPDNLLMFVRRSASELGPSGGSFSFHHRWVMIVALQGQAMLQIDGKPCRLSPGRVLLVPPLHLHGFERIGPDLFWLFITFEWPDHSSLENDWFTPRRLDDRGLEHLEALGRLISKAGGEPLAATHLHSLLHQLYLPLRQPSPAGPSLMREVQKVVEKHPGARGPDIARAVGISESHLRARFRKESGMSLGRYARESNLRKMAIRIRDEGLTIQAAAERAGYPDLFTFSRAFHRTLGYPPSEIFALRKGGAKRPKR
jgi:AraC-like DNA-binding protein/mannose-6-phosphate isomerase-like protein (cupin superfamily)